MKYRVTGANRSTGQDFATTIEAGSQVEARAIGNRSMIVADVEMASSSPTSARECGNCGQPIGKLETPATWAGQSVCATCHARLRSNRKTDRLTKSLAWLIAVPLAAVLAYILWDLGIVTLSAAVVGAVVIGIIAAGVALGSRRRA